MLLVPLRFQILCFLHSVRTRGCLRGCKRCRSGSAVLSALGREEVFGGKSWVSEAGRRQETVGAGWGQQSVDASIGQDDLVASFVATAYRRAARRPDVGDPDSAHCAAAKRRMRR
eukprot:6209080-Pleurochrysis_carterae.AAC.1